MGVRSATTVFTIEMPLTNADTTITNDNVEHVSKMRLFIDWRITRFGAKNSAVGESLNRSPDTTPRIPLEKKTSTA